MRRPPVHTGGLCEGHRAVPFHLAQTRQFEASHPGYTLVLTKGQPFRNLQIIMHEGRWAMVSKNKAPAIHFVIHHPKLCGALENFIPPVIEP